jgi:hypothetical protein
VDRGWAPFLQTIFAFSSLSSPATRVEKQSDVSPRATTSDKVDIRQSHTSGHAGRAGDVWIY